jgi:ribosomal protein S18 acetylase RimI-like enzyme
LKTIHSYKVIGFKAVDNPEICKEYIAGHTKILTDYGIKNITSNNNSWINNKDIYCLALKSQNGELLGGIRIQLANDIYPLPIEDAIGHIDSSIYSLVKKHATDGGIGELSGLWVNNKLKGLGIGWYMVRAAIASSSQLNLKTLIGICGDVTLKMFKNVGFIIDKTLGNNGQFHYPNETLIAHAVGILDAVTLNEASHYDKEIMNALRENFIQRRIENDQKSDVTIEYNLIY